MRHHFGREPGDVGGTGDGSRPGVGGEGSARQAGDNKQASVEEPARTPAGLQGEEGFARLEMIEMHGAVAPLAAALQAAAGSARLALRPLPAPSAPSPGHHPPPMPTKTRACAGRPHAYRGAAVVVVRGEGGAMTLPPFPSACPHESASRQPPPDQPQPPEALPLLQVRHGAERAAAHLRCEARSAQPLEAHCCRSAAAA